MRSCQAERLAAETVDERESRLQQRRDRLAAKSVEGMEMRLQQMSSSQRERLAAWNAEEREIRLQHDREPQGAPRKSLGTRLFNSVLYKPRCKNSMHKWLHWRCPLLRGHRIICLPLLTWNDTCLGDPHPVCD